MSAGGGGAAPSSRAVGTLARLVTVYFSPAREAPGSNTMSVDLSACRVPLAVTLVAGYGTGSAARSSCPTSPARVIVVVSLVADEVVVRPGAAGSRGLTLTRDLGWANSCQPELVSWSSV